MYIKETRLVRLGCTSQALPHLNSGLGWSRLHVQAGKQTADGQAVQCFYCRVGSWRTMLSGTDVTVASSKRSQRPSGCLTSAV